MADNLIKNKFTINQNLNTIHPVNSFNKKKNFAMSPRAPMDDDSQRNPLEATCTKDIYFQNEFSEDKYLENRTKITNDDLYFDARDLSIFSSESEDNGSFLQAKESKLLSFKIKEVSSPAPEKPKEKKEWKKTKSINSEENCLASTSFYESLESNNNINNNNKMERLDKTPKTTNTNNELSIKLDKTGSNDNTEENVSTGLNNHLPQKEDLKEITVNKEDANSNNDKRFPLANNEDLNGVSTSNLLIAEPKEDKEIKDDKIYTGNQKSIYYDLLVSQTSEPDYEIKSVSLSSVTSVSELITKHFPNHRSIHSIITTKQSSRTMQLYVGKLSQELLIEIFQLVSRKIF